MQIIFGITKEIKKKNFFVNMSIIIVLCLAILLTIYINCNIRKLHMILRALYYKQKEQINNLGKLPLLSLADLPGPLSLPFFGTKWIFFLRGYKLSKLHETYEDFNRRYGPIVLEVAASGVPVVHLFEKKDIEKVLRYPSRFPFRPPTEIVVWYRKSRPDRYCSVGITNEQGEIWHKLRSRLTSHITSPRILQNFLPSLNLVFDDFVELLRSKRNPNSFVVENFQDIANLMGLEAVCTLMLGKRMGFLSINSNQSKTITILANAVKQLFISQRDSYYGMGLWKYLPTKTYREFSKSEEIIYDVISELVENAVSEEQKECNDDDVRSIFLNILQINDLDIRDKKSAIIDFIAAGIETLGNTLIFALDKISSHKSAKETILNEFEGYRNTCILQPAITNAVYTKSCLQESYRIQPTAFCLARILEDDLVLSGYEIKAGTVVLCQNMIACKKEQNFKNAKNFVPERWIDKDGTFNINLEGSSVVVPFGFGKRTCPGRRFVEMELVLMIAKLTLAFDISFPTPIETEFEFLLAPKTPVNLILRDRVL